MYERAEDDKVLRSPFGETQEGQAKVSSALPCAVPFFILSTPPLPNQRPTPFGSERYHVVLDKRGG